MKTRSILFTTLCSLMLSLSLTACLDDDENNPQEPTIDPAVLPAYILNEGLWGANNAGIAMFMPGYQGLTKADVYQEMNGKKLGDLANAMIEEDDNIYVVVNGSKYVCRLDLACKEQARHAFGETEGEPRCIDADDKYVYVTQRGGQVSKLDTQTLNVVATFKGGDNLEGIVEEDGKLYVANSYKQDGSGNFIYNNEVLIINASTMQQEGSITVVDNPDKIVEIDGRIYVLSKGNYADIDPALQVIDTNSKTAKTITNAAKITEGNNGLIYGVRSTYDANWQLTNTFFTYNPKTNEVSDTPFLQNAPASFKTDAIYLLEVNEDSKFIYVGTSDYVTNGTIYEFDINGKLVQSFDSGGINPNTMIFID